MCHFQSPLHSHICISVLDVPDIQLDEIDEGEVYRHICDLNIHKAVGVDNISTKFIKASSSGMAVLLTKLIHKSIRFHTFPDVWEECCCDTSSKVQSKLLSV